MRKIPTYSPSIAIIYDRVNTTFGGAENVLQSLHHLYPTAPIFTSVYDAKKATWAKSMVVQPSFLQGFPGAKKHHREYVGLMPIAFEELDLDTFDIVISVTSAEAKGVLTKSHQLHVCYLLTPTRYLWSHADEYRQNPIIEFVKKPIFAYMRWWDLAAAQRPDFFIPISNAVAERCRNYYQRPTQEPIYPPVELQDDGETTFTPELQDYYLVVARLVSYKKIDLAIKSCIKLNRNLLIIGEGPERKKLQKLAADLVSSTGSQAKIQFLQAVQSRDLTAYYKNCWAFLAPGEEDFGIAALESHLFGKPAVLHYKSGAAEISPNGVSSTHLVEQSVDALVSAMETTEQHVWQPDRIRQQVAKYRTSAFEKMFDDRIRSLWRSFNQQMESA